MHEREVARPRLVEARRDSTESLEAVEEELDEVALGVELSILRDCARSFRLGADDGLDAASFELGAKLVGVVPGVSDESTASCVVEELGRCDQFVALAGRQRDVERPTFRVDDRVDFGRKTSSRASQSIALDPPFPPDASWCARTMVPSMIDAVSSTSSWSSRNT